MRRVEAEDFVQKGHGEGEGEKVLVVEALQEEGVSSLPLSQPPALAGTLVRDRRGRENALERSLGPYPGLVARHAG